MSWLAPPSATVFITRGGASIAQFHVELATNIWRRARGLMGRTTLPADGGMLFVYPWPRVVRIWMARVPVALDVVFIDERQVVAKLVEGLAPLSSHWVCSAMPVSRVLELRAGRCARTGIAVGDRVSVHMEPTFDNRPAAGQMLRSLRSRLAHLIGRMP